MNIKTLLTQIPRYKAFRRGYGSSLPANMTFSVIDRCNMACRTCGIWKNRNTDELTVEEYEEIVEPLNLYWITITGGEPFMREDFAEVISLLCNKTDAQIMTIATNGMLEQETRIHMEEILQQTTDTEFVLNFSIDGTSETHEYMRRTKNAFQRVSDTVDTVRSINSDRISIGANTVISKHNEDQIPETYRDVHDKLQPDSYIAEVAEQRDKLYNEEMDFAPENPDKALRFLLEKLGEERRTGKPPKIVRVMRRGFYTYLLRDEDIVNYTGFISAELNPTGELWPTPVEKKVMGNLREDDYDFEKVWKSRQAENVRNHIRRDNPQDMLANSFYNNVICNPQKLLYLLASRS